MKSPMKSHMKSQWQCIQQNIGIWRGSFTQFSPEGEQVKDTPSVLTLEETDADKTMQLTLERWPSDREPDITKRSFSAPGPAPYVYFFETGAFSQGSAQWRAFSQFGAEMCLKIGDRRSRFVIMYRAASDGTSELDYVTLIRETQAGGTQFTEAGITPEQMLGEWTGTSTVLFATMEPAATGTSLWALEKIDLKCTHTFNEQSDTLSLTCTEGSDLSSRQPRLLQGNLAYQLMPLPNGTYCLMPHTIKKDVAFQIEVGWLTEHGDRSRLVRYYDSRGVWMKSALIEDRLSPN